MAAGDQGEELPHDGIGGGRSVQAALEMAKGRLPVLPLDGDRAQVEEHERVVGPLGQLGLEDLEIALKLPLPQRRVGVAGVPDRGTKGTLVNGIDLSTQQPMAAAVVTS